MPAKSTRVKPLRENHLIEIIDEKIYAWTCDRLLDESPAAYRRLSDVMQAQCDLVATRDTLKTVLNYKSL